MLVLAERENAIMSLLEETDRETRDTVERLHWEAVARSKLIMYENDFKKFKNVLQSSEQCCRCSLF
jgi:hypothetical protein